MFILISELIDKKDSSEIVLDQIGAILIGESANQQTLAIADGQNPDDWRFRVFLERVFPWESFRGLDGKNDLAPIINVSYTGSNFGKESSNTFEAQKATGVYTIDCYASAGSSDDGEGGSIPGDMAAAYLAQNFIKLVRNILMASDYCYLGLRGLVWSRWVDAITMYKPQTDNLSVEQIHAARIDMQVTFSEFAPQYVAETLDYTAIDVYREETGELYLPAHYDYTQS